MSRHIIAKHPLGEFYAHAVEFSDRITFKENMFCEEVTVFKKSSKVEPVILVATEDMIIQLFLN